MSLILYLILTYKLINEEFLDDNSEIYNQNFY